MTALSGFGLATALFALAMGRMTQRAARWPVARGRIVESGVDAFVLRRDPDDSSRSLQYRPRVVYSYEVNGRTYSGDRLAMGTVASSSLVAMAQKTADEYPVGREVQVHYNPDGPGESVLHPRSATHLLLWVIAAAILALAWAIATGRIEGRIGD